MPPSPRDDHRFTDEELTLILQRAAEQEGARAALPARTGHSLAEIQAIAAEVGIDPSQVERAAAAVRTERAPAPAGVGVGAPARTRFEEVIVVPGELAAPQASELLDRARELTRQRGVVTQEPDALVWTATDGFGQTQVAVAARLGRTRITVSEDRGSSAIGAVFGGLGVGAAAGVGAVPLLLLTGLGLPAALVLALVLAVVAGLGFGRYWMRRRAARWRERVAWLGGELENAARALLPPGAGTDAP